MHHSLVALVTLIALFVYFWMGLRVGVARGKFNVEAPATTGHPEFERHFRVQANTGEWLLIFLPSLWLFAVYVSDIVAAGVGAVWIAARLVYMFSYVKDPKTRGIGYGVQALATGVLMFGSLGWVVAALVRGGV